MTLKDLASPYVIADVGSNWKTSNNQSDNLIMAKRHIHDAARIGVNAIKFQLFTDQELYGMAGPNKWSLPSAWLPDLAAYAAAQGIDFMCTAFSPLGYATVDPFVNLHKVASAEMNHLGILNRLVSLEKSFLISTGAAHYLEIESCASYLFEQELIPNTDFAFLECVASYPAKPSDYNLRCLEANFCLGNKEHEISYSPMIGVSDHTLSNVVALTAVGLGARVFEKHYCAHDLPGISTPDQCVSVGTAELAQYVIELKEAFSALGDGRKLPRQCERDMTMRHRRRLKVIAPIAEGEELKLDQNFGIFRSITEDAQAASPMLAREFHGKKAKRALEPGDSVWISTVDVGV